MGSIKGETSKEIERALIQLEQVERFPLIHLRKK